LRVPADPCGGQHRSRSREARISIALGWTAIAPTASLAALGGALGLPAGTAMRAEVARLSVRAGEPDETCCRSCAAPMPPAIALRCGHCGHWFGPPFVIELATAAVLALVFARLGNQPDVLAFTYLGILGVALALIDLAVQRLPDRLTLPAYPALIAILAALAAAEGDGTAFARALLGGLALSACFLALGLLSAGQLGGGDIKLSCLLGLASGWLGWYPLVAGACLGFLLAAGASLVLLTRRKVTRHTMISFGPYLLGGTLLAILAAGH